MYMYRYMVCTCCGLIRVACDAELHNLDNHPSHVWMEYICSFFLNVNVSNSRSASRFQCLRDGGRRALITRICGAHAAMTESSWATVSVSTAALVSVTAKDARTCTPAVKCNSKIWLTTCTIAVLVLAF